MTTDPKTIRRRLPMSLKHKKELINKPVVEEHTGIQHRETDLTKATFLNLAVVSIVVMQVVSLISLRNYLEEQEEDHGVQDSKDRIIMPNYNSL